MCIYVSAAYQSAFAKRVFAFRYEPRGAGGASNIGYLYALILLFPVELSHLVTPENDIGHYHCDYDEA
jgi:hypothetical protein